MQSRLHRKKVVGSGGGGSGVATRNQKGVKEGHQTPEPIASRAGSRFYESRAL